MILAELGPAARASMATGDEAFLVGYFPLLSCIVSLLAATSSPGISVHEDYAPLAFLCVSNAWTVISGFIEHHSESVNRSLRSVFSTGFQDKSGPSIEPHELLMSVGLNVYVIVSFLSPIGVPREKTALVFLTLIILLAPKMIWRWSEHVRTSLDSNTIKSWKRFVRGHFSSRIFTRLLTGMQQVASCDSGDSSGRVSIRASATSHISAIWSLDSDVSAEMKFMIPPDWPLEAEGIKVIKTDTPPGFPPQLLASLEAEITTAMDSGNLVGAVLTWSQGLNQYQDSGGIEECVICIHRLHPSSKKPCRRYCSTCLKMLHEECLQKWLSSSRDWRCPHCTTRRGVSGFPTWAYPGIQRNRDGSIPRNG